MPRQRRGPLLPRALLGPSRRPGRGRPIAPDRRRLRLGQLARMAAEQNPRPAARPQRLPGGPREIQGDHRGRRALARVPQRLRLERPGRTGDDRQGVAIPALRHARRHERARQLGARGARRPPRRLQSERVMPERRLLFHAQRERPFHRPRLALPLRGRETARDGPGRRAGRRHPAHGQAGRDGRGHRRGRLRLESLRQQDPSGRHLRGFHQRRRRPDRGRRPARRSPG